MKKPFKTLFSLSMAACILAVPAQAYAATPETVEIQEINVTPEQLSDGVTVLLTFNDDGTYNQSVYTDESAVPVPTATADGELEWATFHLGFKDWNNDTGDLYFTVSADEAMRKVRGDAYVKSTGVLFSTYYYDDSFSESLYSPYNTSRTFATDIDTEDETKVRVGFKNVILYTTAGDTGSFSNFSQIVSR